MKTLLYLPLLLIGLLIATVTVKAEGNESTATTTHKTARMEIRLSQSLSKKNVYTLALHHQSASPATIKILAQDGTQIYRAKVREEQVVRHFDMRPLEPGKYVLQISDGTLFSEQPITVE